MDPSELFDPPLDLAAPEEPEGLRPGLLGHVLIEQGQAPIALCIENAGECELDPELLEHGPLVDGRIGIEESVPYGRPARPGYLCRKLLFERHGLT